MDLLQRLQAQDRSGPVIIRSNRWGEAFNPLVTTASAGGSVNMVYQPLEALMVSMSIAARLISANR
jgi:hypothetical protein